MRDFTLVIPDGIFAEFLPRMDKIIQLIDVLDRYRPEPVEVSAPEAPHDGVPA